MTLATASTVLSYFLYGDSAPPAQLVDGDLIRSADSTSITVDTQSYMDSVGRFALACRFDIISDFFASQDLAPKYDGEGQVVPYTKEELADIFGLSFFGLNIEQYQVADAIGDYAERTLIWNSSTYKLADNIEFWVEPDGTKHIANLSIIPRVPENFNLLSDSLPTQVANEFYLKERLDPYAIGRTVNINFGGEVQERNYTIQDYNADVTKMATWFVPSNPLESIQTLLDQLHEQNIISPFDGDGRPIVYGSNDADGLSEASADKPYYEGHLNAGIAFVAGDGNDSVVGGSGADLIEGGFGNDTLDGGGGTDVAKYSGPCSDYDITKNENGSWTISHVRGAATDGTDTLTNIEKIQFGDKVEDLKLGLCGKDIVFVIDTTGSMTDDIAGVKAQATALIDSLFSETQHVRVAIIGYKDPGETQVFLNFTDQDTVAERKAAAISAINAIQVGEGGDTPEGVYSGLLAALTGAAGQWNEDAHVHRILVFGDAEAKDSSLQSEVEALARNLGAQTQGFATGQAGEPGSGFESSYAEIATIATSSDSATTGSFYDIASHNNGQTYFGAGQLASAANAAVIPTSFGTPGDDSLTAPEAGGRLRGDLGNDILIGSGGADLLYGEDGDDTLQGGAGNDLLDGGAGDDTFISGAGADTIRGGRGMDIAHFAGNYADYTVLTGPAGTTVTNNNTGETDSLQTIEKLAFDDQVIDIQVNYHLVGGAGSDTLVGGAGDDILEGGGGFDTLQGGDGDDILKVGDEGGTLDGGYGSDIADFSGSATPLEVDLSTEIASSRTSHQSTLLASIENVIGSAFDDVFIGTSADNRIDGGAGRDSMSYEYSQAGVTIDLSVTDPQGTGSDGRDTLISIEDVKGSEYDDALQGSAADNVLTGLDGDDTLIGGDGNDILDGGFGNDVIVGGQGVDTVSFASGGPVQVDLRSAVANAGFYGIDQIAGIENVIGSSDNDEITGDSASNVLTGGRGNDLLSGGGGDDTYRFSIGFEQDVVRDWSGDAVSGGFDTIEFQAATSPFEHVIAPSDVTVTLGNGGQDIILNIELSGDQITIAGQVTDARNHIEQVRFADGTIWTDADLLALAGGGDTTLYGDNTDNTINGGSGKNTIYGLGGNDALFGLDGDDTLIGGSGDDYLDGGAGQDTAKFSGHSSVYELMTDLGVLTITDADPVTDGSDGVDQLVDIETLAFKDGSFSLWSPIILDLNGNGQSLIAAAQSHQSFDIDGDGHFDGADWIEAGDAFLVIDRDGDGTVSNAGELSFTGDKPGALSDLDGLRAFDTNGDGWLSADDEQWASFKIWQDDGDGIAEGSELRSLAQSGISAIDLAGSPTNERGDLGHAIVVNTGSYMKTDGSSGGFSDVTFSFVKGAPVQQADSLDPLPHYQVEQWRHMRAEGTWFNIA